MQRYNVLNPLGDGAFGEVWLAIDKQTGEKVAIKRIKKKYVACSNYHLDGVTPTKRHGQLPALL